MDQRLLATGLGAVIGLALVVALAIVRPPASLAPGGVAGAPGLVASLPPPLPPDDLASAFARPGPASIAGEDVQLTTSAAGHVRLPTGRLAIADAFYLGIDSHVVSRMLPAGDHPVTILHAADEAYLEPAAALVTAPGSVRRWVLVPEASYAGADTGVVALAPAELDERLARDEGAAEMLTERLVERIEATIGDPASPWVEVESVDDLTLYAIPSEFGLEAAHWGLDGAGEPVALLLDFGLLDDAGGG